MLNFFVIATTLHAQSRRAPQPEDLYQLMTVSEPRWSQNGIVFVATTTSEEKQKDISMKICSPLYNWPAIKIPLRKCPGHQHRWLGTFSCYTAKPQDKLPGILRIHGSPQWFYGSDFSLDFHVYAMAGYALFFCNPRGSTTYGAAFSDAIRGDWGNHVNFCKSKENR